MKIRLTKSMIHTINNIEPFYSIAGLISSDADRMVVCLSDVKFGHNLLADYLSISDDVVGWTKFRSLLGYSPSIDPYRVINNSIVHIGHNELNWLKSVLNVMVGDMYDYLEHVSFDPTKIVIFDNDMINELDVISGATITKYMYAMHAVGNIYTYANKYSSCL